jgi:hypothetical protein
MYCNNCGKKGHLYKECKLPVTSCGNIVFRLDRGEPEILMIQRKDSLCYIDFIRGKYDIKNENYLQILIDKCSSGEKDRLLTLNFSELWSDLWLLGDNYIQNDDFFRCSGKFNTIREGFLIDGTQINIEYLINNSEYN